MTTDVFCAWGEGVPIGINYKRTRDEAARYSSTETQWFVTLTVEEARLMAAQLISAADAHDAMDRQYQDYVEAGNS